MFSTASYRMRVSGVFVTNATRCLFNRLGRPVYQVKSREVHEPALHRAALKPHPTPLLPSVATAATQRRVGEGGATPGGALPNTPFASQPSAQIRPKWPSSSSVGVF